MDSDIRKELTEMKALIEENNKILRSMRRSQMWGRVFSFLYWIIMIGIVLGAYYFVQPYLEGVLGAYQGLLQGVEGIENIGGQLPDIKVLLESFRQ